MMKFRHKVTRGFRSQIIVLGEALFLLLASASVFAEGSAQIGLTQGLQDFDESRGPSDANQASLFIDILAVNEVINISLCGFVNGDDIDIEIFGPGGSSVFTTSLTSSNVDCADPMSAPLTNPVRYTATSVGAHRIVLQNTSRVGANESIFERYDISVTPDSITDPDPTVAAGRLWA